MAKRFLYLIELSLIICAVLGAAGCGNNSSSQGDGRLSIAVSIPPQASLLRSIAGDSIDIFTLLRADSNPESFEPAVSDMKNIYGADAYFSIGHLPFEQSLVSKIRQSAPDLKYYDNSAGVDLIYGTHDHLDCSHHGHNEGHSHDAEGGADPHIWSSVVNLKIIAANMLDALKELSPENAEIYTYNYNKLVARLDSLDTAYRNRLTGENISFLVWHPSLSYFARDYGLHQIAVGQENKELSVKQFKEKIDHAADSSVGAFFIQRNMDATQAESLVRQLGVNIVEINPLDQDWEYQLNIIADAVAQ